MHYQWEMNLFTKGQSTPRIWGDSESGTQITYIRTIKCGPYESKSGSASQSLVQFLLSQLVCYTPAERVWWWLVACILPTHPSSIAIPHQTTLPTSCRDLQPGCCGM